MGAFESYGSCAFPEIHNNETYMVFVDITTKFSKNINPNIRWGKFPHEKIFMEKFSSWDFWSWKKFISYGHTNSSRNWIFMVCFTVMVWFFHVFHEILSLGSSSKTIILHVCDYFEGYHDHLWWNTFISSEIMIWKVYF